MKKVKMILVVIVLIALAGCPKNDMGQPTEIENLKQQLVIAQSIIKQINNELPLVYEAMDALCPEMDKPGWCAEMDVVKRDVEDALIALDILIIETIILLDAGSINDPAVVTSQIIHAATKVVTAYIRIQAIINRHID